MRIRFRAKLRRRKWGRGEVYEVTIPKVLAEMYGLDKIVGKKVLVTLRYPPEQ